MGIAYGQIKLSHTVQMFCYSHLERARGLQQSMTTYENKISIGVIVALRHLTLISSTAIRLRLGPPSPIFGLAVPGMVS